MLTINPINSFPRCCPLSIRTSRLCRSFPAPCLLDGSSETQSPYDNWAPDQGNNGTNGNIEPFAAINRFTGQWFDFPGGADYNGGFTMYSVCQKEIRRARSSSSITSSIPLSEMNFDATSERAASALETADGPIPIGQVGSQGLFHSPIPFTPSLIHPLLPIGIASIRLAFF